jgi:hypothetical protein
MSTKTASDSYQQCHDTDAYRYRGPSKQASPIPTGVWVAYTHMATLFEKDCPVVLFDNELNALRYAIKDSSRIIKVTFVPFGKPIADYLT